MKMIFLFLLILNSFAFAQDIRIETFKKMPTCYKGVQFRDDLMIVNSAPFEITVKSMTDAKINFSFELSAEYTDMILEGQTLYVLTLDHIEEWDLATQKMIRTIATSKDTTPPYRAYMNPKGFGLYNSRFYVAHEGQGVSIIDQKSGNYIDMIGMEGLPQDISFKANKAYIIADEAVMTAGQIHPAIYIVDLNSQKVIKKTILRNAPAGSINVIDSNIYIGHLFYWRLDLNKVETKDTLNGYSKLLFPTPWAKGKPFMDEKNLYYCNEIREPSIIIDFKK